jgi:TRAP-type C4-dicarboxylate transport system substrate-binding protein
VEAALLDAFAAETARLSGGALAVEVAHGNAFGLDDAAGLQWLPEGRAEIALLWGVFLQGRVPELRAAYPMGVARSLDEHVRALPVMERLNREVLEAAGVVPLAMFPSPVLHISVFARRTPVHDLQALRGRKLRVFSLDLEPTFRRLGVEATFIPQGELYDALAADRFDATIYPACHTAWSVPLWRVTDHASYLFPEVLQPYVLGIPQSVWSTLGGSERDALDQAARAVWPGFLRYAYDRSAEDAARINLAAAGLTWHQDFPPADRQLLRDSATETWREMAGAVGERLLRHRADALAAMRRFG